MPRRTCFLTVITGKLKKDTARLQNIFLWLVRRGALRSAMLALMARLFFPVATSMIRSKRRSLLAIKIPPLMWLVVSERV